ncbi:MAG: pentapeptide repeat-containing protein [Fibrobacteres bacterium]|nr:pentapeptide repeat-containing protein [Fibrobacterota bacterium]
MASSKSSEFLNLEAILQKNGNSLTNEDLSNRDLSGFNFSGCVLNGVNFFQANSRGANFDGATLSENTRLKAADIHGTSWKSAKLLNVALGDAESSVSVLDAIGDRNALEGIRVQFGSNNRYDDYSKLNLRGSIFSGLVFEPSFQESDLSKAKIELNYSGSANFNQTKLKNTEIKKFEGDSEEKDSFRGAVFEATKFFQNFQFLGTDFAEASFVGVDFSGTSFSDCNFENTKFKDCDFDGVGFFGTSFKGVDFSDQTFSQTEFENCSLTESNFSDCEISNSHLTSCAILRSNFSKAQMEGVTISQDCHFEECDFNGARLTKAEIEDVYLSQPFAFIGATIL